MNSHTRGHGPSIELVDVEVRYGDVVALRDTTLAIRPGRVTGLIGMNGSGKSTLIKAVVGAVRPEHGRVLVAGADPASARRRGLVGYVPQNESIDWTFPVSVRDVVMMGRYRRLGFTRGARATDHDAVASALERVQLTDLAYRQIGRLSGGQRKRAFVARAIAQDARILLLDEPFAGVDKASEATVVGLLRDLADEGRTVLVSTHDLHALPQLADEAVLLLGRPVFHGGVDEALHPANVVRAFGLDPIRNGGHR